MFSVRSVFSRRPFFYKLSFFGREENFLNQAKHICETCTLCQPETHLIILSAFTFTKHKKNVFFSTFLEYFAKKNNIQGNINIMIKNSSHVYSFPNPQCRQEKGPCQPDHIHEIGRLLTSDNGKGSPYFSIIYEE